MRKITPQNKAHQSKKAQTGMKKQTERRLHNKKLKLQWRAWRNTTDVPEAERKQSCYNAQSN